MKLKKQPNMTTEVDNPHCGNNGAGLCDECYADMMLEYWGESNAT